MRQTHGIPAVRGQYSPKRTVTNSLIERRVNPSPRKRRHGGIVTQQQGGTLWELQWIAATS